MNVKRIFLILAVCLVASPAVAKTETESEVVLPLEAQTCNLPVAPARIPEDADLDGLKIAKGNVTGFQTDMVGYRECLEEAIQTGIATDGNRAAVSNAHNYSVGMEERIAEQFNVAVRAYKARKAEEQE